MKVAIVGLRLDETRYLGKFEVHGVPLRFATGLRWSTRRFLTDGLNAIDYSRSVVKSEFVDEFYRNSDPAYMAAANQLVRELEAFDIVIFSTNCPLHPEILASKLRNKIKVLGFTDDPHSTYVRGIPCLWAFDAAYYISPGYSPTMGFAELFQKVGFSRVRWLPLAQPIQYPTLTIDEVRNRNLQITYVGNPTGSKIDRIAAIDRAFGRDFALHGRWRLNGFYGYVRPFLGEKAFLRRVHSLSASEKRALYLNTKIALNMHVSDVPSECGNMRTYETAAFGMMPLCDRGGLNLQNQIFEEGVEAVYYDTTDEAIELARHYLNNPEERSRIAFAAHLRARADYSWEKVTLDYLNWLTN